MQDWLYGVRTNAPQKDIHTNLSEEPVTEAERLRLLYLLMTKSHNEGGAGIAPKSGEWKNVEAIFALHDQKFNKSWVTSLTSKYFLNEKDFKEIKDRFGEKIAFYFTFLQAYFLALTFPPSSDFAAGFSWANFLLFMPSLTGCGASYSLSTGGNKRLIWQFSGVSEACRKFNARELRLNMSAK